MLEDAIKQNTAAMLELTKVILQNGNCTPVAEKPKRPRRTKAEIEADNAAVKVEKPAPGLDLGVGTEAATTSNNETEVTIDMLKANGKGLVGCGKDQAGLTKARELIAAFGVKTIDEIKPEDYAKLNSQFIEEAKNWGKTSEANTAL